LFRFVKINADVAIFLEVPNSASFFRPEEKASMRSTKTLSAEGTWTRGSGILRLREDLEHRETSRVIIWNVRLVPGSDTRIPNDGTTCRKPLMRVWGWA